MNILKNRENGNLTIALEGRLDTNTAPQLDEELTNNYEGLENLVLDFANLEYVSSAGLRVLLSAQKQMNKQGKMVLKNVRPEIKEVFDITGFAELLTIE